MVKVALNKGNKKIMLKKQWFSWLPNDVITKCEFYVKIKYRKVYKISRKCCSHHYGNI